ncbi:recombinase family protein [Pseudomonas monteilii]|uniref:recombinase family protein n=1 Tax=Pseudomonas monteilii TaxID=76759 RepID=UPI0015F7BEC9|nr:recombinase family protein [Pseudomonas monteilii]MBA6090656.1 recombinase family protein [Pseudomonas monteilii]
MSRTFVYARVSTTDQTTDNQLLEIKSAGFSVEPHRVITETISGSTQASERPGFQKLLERMEKGDVLIVTKLDRLGRNAMDVRQSVEMLANDDIRVHCLALGGVDLTSAAGKMTMQVLSAVAEFERDLLIERTHAGINRAKSEGKKLGRPEAVGTTKEVQECKADGLSQSQTAKKLHISLATIKRHWNKSA